MNWIVFLGFLELNKENAASRDSNKTLSEKPLRGMIFYLMKRNAAAGGDRAGTFDIFFQEAS